MIRILFYIFFFGGLFIIITLFIIGIVFLIKTAIQDNKFYKDTFKDIERMLDALAEELKQMENIDVIDRVKEEMNQFEIKKQKLSDFIASEKFTKLSDTHKFLLKKQLEVQKLYVDILKQRLKLFESEN